MHPKTEGSARVRDNNSELQNHLFPRRRLIDSSSRSPRCLLHLFPERSQEYQRQFACCEMSATRSLYTLSSWSRDWMKIGWNKWQDERKQKSKYKVSSVSFESRHMTRSQSFTLSWQQMQKKYEMREKNQWKKTKDFSVKFKKIQFDRDGEWNESPLLWNRECLQIRRFNLIYWE